MKLFKRWCYWSGYRLGEQKRYVWVEIDLKETEHKFSTEKGSVLNWYVVIDTNDYSIVDDILREYNTDNGETLELKKNEITLEEKEKVFSFAKECAKEFKEAHI